ncbi:hypothetical protein ACFVFQ_04385 [Streptomyces sp. NPDC057743]|uniref:hypothetical protein n=1 Tax=Streptomyces sp. NPDC057743 TaxID=3346236 RepID=UPI0036C93FF1
MRTARTLFASAAITAALTISAPAASAMGLVEDFTSGSATSVSGNDHDNDHGRGGRDHGRGDRDRDHGRGDRDRDHGRGDRDDNGRGDRDDHGRDNDNDHDHGWGHHRKPHGGVHTGGGALAMRVIGDWGSGYGDDHGRGDRDRDHGRGDRDRDHGRGDRDDNGRGDRDDHGRGDRDDHGRGDHDHGRGDHDHWGRRPHGGVHTGGGGMAMSGSGLAAGSVLMLGGLGAGAYMLRRRNTSGTAA